MEKIISIVETDWKGKYPHGYEKTYEGFIVTTDEQEIKVGIDNQQNCCESWGYLMSHDAIDEFIGAKLLDIKIVDAALNVKSYTEVVGEYGVDGGGTMFVNFETDKGTFQLVAYNAHNGYYSHDAVVISKQLNVSEFL